MSGNKETQNVVMAVKFTATNKETGKIVSVISGNVIDTNEGSGNAISVLYTDNNNLFICQAERFNAHYTINIGEGM